MIKYFVLICKTYNNIHRDDLREWMVLSELREGREVLICQFVMEVCEQCVSNLPQECHHLDHVRGAV